MTLEKGRGAGPRPATVLEQVKNVALILADLCAPIFVDKYFPAWNKNFVSKVFCFCFVLNTIGAIRFNFIRSLACTAFAYFNVLNSSFRLSERPHTDRGKGEGGNKGICFNAPLALIKTRRRRRRRHTFLSHKQ